MINDRQYDQLMKPLHASRIAKRSGGGGKSLSYLEAWDVKAHLIRIFGFGGFSADVIESTLAYEEQGERNWSVGYKVVLRLTIPSLEATYTEAAIGSAQLPQRGEAHDMAIKTAESDALKRAAINLGTQFGLSLYNDGDTKDVVHMTLDRDTVSQPADDTPTEPEPDLLPDSEDAAMWIEALKAAIADSDVPAILEIKKELVAAKAEDLIFQKVTLAKWVDKAVVAAGKKS